MKPSIELILWEHLAAHFDDQIAEQELHVTRHETFGRTDAQIEATRVLATKREFRALTQQKIDELKAKTK